MHSDTFADEVERQFLQGRRPPSSSSPLKKGDPFSTPLKKRTSSSPNPVLGLPLTKNLPSPPQSSPPSSSSLPFRRSTHSLGTVHQGVLAVQQHAFGKDSGWKRTVPPRERLDEAHTKAINFVSWQSAGLRALQTLSKNKKLDPVLLKNATLNHPLPLNTTTTTTTTHSHPTPPSQGGKGEETSEGGNVTSSLLPFTSKHPSQEEHPSLLGKDVEITSFPSLYTVTFEKLFEFLRKGSTTATTLNPKLIRLKDEIYLQLPHPIPTCFKDFYNSRECDVFLQNGVSYIQLYLLQQKAKLSANSKAGIDQLKRSFLAQSSLRQPRESQDRVPDFMEELKMDQKEVFRTFCLGYSQILQSFGGSMNFAVERSFYERFYLALGYFFKAHIPPADWPCVSSHLSYVLHADLDASMNSVTGPFKKKKKWKDQRTSSYHGNGQLGGPRRKSSMKSNPCQAFDLFNEQGTPSVSSLRPPPHQKDTHPLFNPNSVHHSTVAAVAAAGMAHLKSSPSILKKKSSGPSTSYYHGGKEKRVSLVSSNLDLQVDPPLQNESKTSTSEQPTPVLPTDKNKHFSKLRPPFSLKSLIHSRSPLIAYIRPAPKDRSNQLLLKSRKIIQHNQKIRQAMTHNVPCATPHFPSPDIGPSVIDPPVVLPTKPPPPTSTSPPPLRSSLIGTTSKPHATPMLRNSFTKPRLSKAPLYKMKSSFMHSRRPALKFQTIEEENEFRHLTNAHPSNSLIKSNVEL